MGSKLRKGLAAIFLVYRSIRKSECSQGAGCSRLGQKVPESALLSLKTKADSYKGRLSLVRARGTAVLVLLVYLLLLPLPAKKIWRIFFLSFP